MVLVVKKPGEEPEAVRTRASLSDLQAFVGGYIELAWAGPDYFTDGRLVVYCNEDGIQLELPYNLPRPTDQTPILGTIVVGKERDGELVEMSEAELRLVLGHFTSYAEACAQMTRAAN